MRPILNRRAAAIWAGIVAGIATGVAVYDLRCDRRKDDSTLSSIIRWLVETIPGGVHLFTLGLFAGAIGFWRHIVRPIGRRRSATSFGR